MRTASVFTHFRCNQHCTYCTFRRAQDEPRFIARAAVEARIRAAIADGAVELALSGGEPTLRNDLEALIAVALAAGAERVVLETNAVLVDAARAESLRAAGLSRAVVNLVGAGPEVDAVTQDEGGFEATCRGVAALLSAGVEVVVKAAVVASTRSMILDLPAMLARTFDGRVAGIALVLPTESPDANELLSYPVSTEIVTRVADAARVAGLPVKLAPETAPPPCVFPELGRVAHLFTLTPGAGHRSGRVRVSACAACSVADRCDGFAASYVGRFGAPDVTPVTEDRMRRRLSLISTVEEQIARELVTRDRYGDDATGVVDEDLIRVNFHCNQSCRFCFVSTHLPMATDAAVRAAILDAADAGRRITLTGGEPTLNASLVDYVRLAKERSAHPIRLQTNAIRFTDAALADAVVAAGVTEAFVSLHGSTAEISDGITHAPGTFAKTIRGVDALVARGVVVILNFVLCESNLADLVPYVRFVAERWPGVRLNLSFVAPSTDVVPRDREFVPRYTEAMPHLGEAIHVARSLGVELIGFESMCGIPLCLVPAALDRYAGLLEHTAGHDAGEFVAAPACASCDLRGRCHGVRRGYAELHGTGELRSVRLAREDAPA